MPFPAGAKLGPYEILGPIGAGGMGEVHRARDTRLGRDVAIKTLPAGLGRDADRLRRFELEARAASLLSHPNILTVYDVGTSDGQPYIVSELLEGENLRERLTRGQIPSSKSIEIAASVADGLAAAHARGIIHRDLKPENIFLTRDGRVKILDFGIAKLTIAESAQPAAAATVTIFTDAGVAVGTLGYMAPEQVRGEPADPRSDIFAVGALLYEMLAGAPAFRSDSRVQTINAVLESDPAPLPEPLAPALRQVVGRCLEKDADGRFQTARDLAFALRTLSGSVAAWTGPRPAATAVSRFGWWPIAVAAVAASAITAAVVRILPDTVPPVRVTKRFVFQPTGSPGIFDISPDISPDGRQLAFVGAGATRRQLFVKTFDELDARPVAGTDGANGPFFSPDGEWIAFSADGKLKKIAARGGAAITLSDAPQYLGGSWASNGQIAIAVRESGLRRVSAEGGTLEPLTTPDASRGEVDHHAPHWLPGGRALLLTLHAGVEIFRVAVRSIDTGDQRTLIEDGFDARYVESGHIVYGRANSLFAAPFDLERLAITGPSVPVVENVYTISDSGVASFSVARDGTLAYFAEVPRKSRTLIWVDRTGKAETLPTPAQEYDFPTLSPDGSRMAVQVSEGAHSNIFVYEFATEVLRRVTLEGAESRPLWSPDGMRLTYAARRKEERHLFWQALDGSAPAESLVAGRNDLWPVAWTPDGQALAFVESPPTEVTDIKIVRRGSNPLRIEALVAGRTEDLWPGLSPNGQWIVYAADDIGGYQVYVRPFGGGAPRQISANGGTEPRWSRDGREVFYRSQGRMLRVPIQTGPPLVVGKPDVLFADVYRHSDAGPPDYDVSSDGQRFLMVKPGDEERAPKPIHIVLDWFEELKRRVPTRP